MPLRDHAPLGAPCWVDLFTSKPDVTRPFYCDLFGWTIVDPGADYGGYQNFQKDGVMVAGSMGHDGSDPAAQDAWSVYLAVEDATKTAEAMVAAGGQIYVPAMDVMDLGAMAVGADPTGAAIGVWQPKEHQGFGVLAEPSAPAWFELMARDYDAALRFYQDVFGWETTTMSDTPEFRYTTLGEGDGALAGIMDASAFPAEDVPSHWSVYFNVEDTDASVARAVELGATIVDAAMDTPYGRMATLTDPGGARFKVIA